MIRVKEKRTRLSEGMRKFARKTQLASGAVVFHWANKVAKLEEKLAEYENDETARRQTDAYKIRTLELIVIDMMEYFEADYTRPSFYNKAVKFMDGD